MKSVSSEAGGGGIVRHVRGDSPGARVGIRAGDRLLAIDGHPLRDEIDFRFYASEPSFDLSFERAGEAHVVSVTRAFEDGDVGVDFENPLFDGVRLCRNRCGFCFVTQLPEGVRKSLLVRDDDYRLSFLSATFVTLTNLTASDWQRIEEQHLSPLYVSVHATDPGVRGSLLGATGAPGILEQLRRLSDSGIEVHSQIVLVPGVNDGAVLARTLDDLRKLYPAVQSVSLVPVGLTRFHDPYVRLLSRAEARAAVAIARRHQVECRREWGVGWVYPSDEMLLLAGMCVPSGTRYDGYPQLQNGVGLIRAFMDDWRRTRRRLVTHGERSRLKGVASTGMAFAPILTKTIDSLNALVGCDVKVIAVANRWLGETVTVAGLLAGKDVIAAAAGADVGDRVFLPRSMLDQAGVRTLDDMHPWQLESLLGRPVTFVDSMSDVVHALLDGNRHS